MQTKLTVRLEKQWITAAKRYAQRHGTTLSRLIGEYLRTLEQAELPSEGAPVLKRLSGILPPTATLDEQHQHLRQKYNA